MKELEYLIVGQGIAGSVLAHQLEQRKKRFCVIDKGHDSSASFVAAGVINPLVLKRMTLSWRADEFLNYMQDFYPKMDHAIGIKSFHQTPLNKLIQSEEEIDFWKQRWKVAELDDFANYELQHFHHDKFKRPYVLGKVKRTAWIDLKSLLPAYRNHLKVSDKLIEEKFDYMELDNRQYKDLLFEKVIFCEGSHAKYNPYFDNLPFDFNKGDLLTIRAPSLELNEIYKKKVFVIPLGNDAFRIGATYQKRAEKEYNSSIKRAELLKNFEDIFNCEYEVIEQESGLRPTVKDRRPILGRHPLLSNFYLFNGLGSRGCLMSPLLAEELLSHIENGTDLHKELRLDRFA